MWGTRDDGEEEIENGIWRGGKQREREWEERREEERSKEERQAERYIERETE